MKRHWPFALSAVICISTIVFASLAQMLLRREAGVPIPYATAVLWQGAIYLSWLPCVAVMVWIVRRLGLTARLILVLYLVTGVAALLHAGAAAAIDAGFNGHALTLGRWLNRLPVDLLIATAIAALVAAVRGYRLSEEARNLAAALQQALDAARSVPAQGRLSVSTGRKTVPVDIAAIVWCAAAGNYVTVNWIGGDGELRDGLIRETLSALSETLDPALFARAHRSTLINLSRVSATATLPDGGWAVTMEGGAELVVSRTYRDDILARLTPNKM